MVILKFMYLENKMTISDFTGVFKARFLLNYYADTLYLKIKEWHFKQILISKTTALVPVGRRMRNGKFSTQSPHMTTPHSRQWCFRFKIPNLVFSQIGQIAYFSSSSQGTILWQYSVNGTAPTPPSTSLYSLNTLIRFSNLTIPNSNRSMAACLFSLKSSK